MAKVKVSSKGQIVIPKELRKGLGIKTGKKVSIEEVNGVLILIPVPKNPVEMLKGLTKGVFRRDAMKLVRDLREEWQ